MGLAGFVHSTTERFCSVVAHNMGMLGRTYIATYIIQSVGHPFSQPALQYDCCAPVLQVEVLAAPGDDAADVNTAEDSVPELPKVQEAKE